jgi:flagellar biogenesis protein FliO
MMRVCFLVIFLGISGMRGQIILADTPLSTNTVLNVSPQSVTSENATRSQGNEIRAFDPTTSFFRVLGALIFVLGIFYWGAYIFRNRVKRSGGQGIGSKIQILETRYLGNRMGLHVICYGKCRFLVGTSPNGINKVTDLPDLQDHEYQILTDNANVSIPGPFNQFQFGRILNQAVNRSSSRHDESEKDLK